MCIHREGYSTLTKLAAGLLTLCGLSYLLLPRRGFGYVVGGSALIFGFFTQFFRNELKRIDAPALMAQLCAQLPLATTIAGGANRDEKPNHQA